jgi:hypothetical protein
MISGLSLFPGGAIGVGLLLLRLSVAGSLLLLAVMLSDTANWLQFLAILGAASLCAGFQTRMLASFSLVAPIASLAIASVPLSLAALHLVDAFALALTGAGAWSVDAALFGRRIVTLPDRNDTIV